MIRTKLSLNFMHCMERFATQIYRTQRPAFNGGVIPQQLTGASENEATHVQRLRAQIKKLNFSLYPLGFLFQSAGFVLGIITRLSGKSNLFRADTFVEKRAIKDYSGFLKAVPFDADTAGLIRLIIADEEVHVANWKKAAESFGKTKASVD